MSKPKQIPLEDLVGTFSQAECHVQLAITNPTGKLLFVKISQNEASAFLDCRKTTNVIVKQSSERPFAVLVGKVITSEVPAEVICTQRGRVCVSNDNECISVEGRCLQLFDEDAWKFFTDEGINQEYEFSDNMTTVQVPLASFKEIFDLAKNGNLTPENFPRIPEEEQPLQEIIEEPSTQQEEEETDHKPGAYAASESGSKRHEAEATHESVVESDDEDDDVLPNGQSSIKEHTDVLLAIKDAQQLKTDIIEIIEGTIGNLEKENEETARKLKDATSKLSKLQSIKRRRPQSGKQLESTNRKFNNMRATLEQQKSDSLVLANNLVHMLHQVINYMVPPDDD